MKVLRGRVGMLGLLLLGVLVLAGSVVDEEIFTYRIRVNEQPFGFHQYRLTRQKHTLFLTSQTLLGQEEEAWQALETTELDAETLLPRRYYLQQFDGLLRSDIEIVFSDRVAAITRHIRSSQWTEDLTYREIPLLLDNNMVDHYALLARRFDPSTRRGQQFQTFVPRGNKLVTVVFRSPTSQEAQKGWTAAGNLAGHVNALFALHPRSHHLLRMAVPDQSYRAELTDDPMPAVSLPPLPSPRPVRLVPLPTRFQSEEVRFKASDGMLLAGTLTVPLDPPLAPLPALLLLHGSGPLDRDEQIGPNRPFAELAAHLSCAGYAVFRYDKRRLGQAGDRHESPDRQTLLADAAAAVAYLRGRQQIDPHRIFLLGHSEGGELAPSLVLQDPEIAGLILMAGPATPLDKTVLRQTAYLLRQRGRKETTIEFTIQNLREQFSRVRAGDLRGPPITGFPRTWWQQTLAVDFVAQIRRVPCPILILQGEKDYQVLPQEAERLATAARAAGNKDITLYRFSGLNHLFQEVEGTSTGEEYSIPGRLAPEVIRTLLAWLKSRT